MVLLALDTTTAAGSVALWRDGLIEERAGDPARSHAERLPGDVTALLGAHGLAPRDVERYAVAAGPGSFTGVRIGIATIQGLALVGDRLVHAVGTLELLAHDAARAADAAAGTTIIAWMEAYRGEVFAARYRVVQASPHTTADVSGVRVRGGARLAVLDPPTVSAPEPLARAWAALAAAHGDAATRPHAVVPIYVRRPDAELARDRAAVRPTA
jgi:tRNA threonylcarbamoyladenosine biosynthesis protein TsaB